MIFPLRNVSSGHLRRQWTNRPLLLFTPPRVILETLRDTSRSPSFYGVILGESTTKYSGVSNHRHS